MDSDLLETKGCKEPMENLETFSTQRSAAEGDGETPEPVLKAPRRRTACQESDGHNNNSNFEMTQMISEESKLFIAIRV